MFKSLFEKLTEKRLFKTIYFEIHLTDGSVQKTDPITFKKFKELVGLKIQGEELRKPNIHDYKEEYENIVKFVEKPYLSDYFSVSIRGKTVELSSRNIIKVTLHKD